MSTKTLRKRIALVAVSALTAGVLSVASAPVETKSTPVVKAVKPVTTNIISNEDLALHMQLSVDQLATAVLMLQVLDQTDGGPAPTE